MLLSSTDLLQVVPTTCRAGAPRRVVHLADQIKNYNKKPRYPDEHPFPKVPAEVYSKKDAEKALQVADEIVTIFIPNMFLASPVIKM
jgi:HEPN domain-containing protein